MLKGHLFKLFAVMFILFLLVGNLTAPSELTSDDVQVNGVMGVFYHFGKFIIVPFENLKYRLSGDEYSQFDSPQLESTQYTPQTPSGYTKVYFEVQGEKYWYYKPIHSTKSPVKEEFTLIKTDKSDLLWRFSIQDLMSDMNSDVVNGFFKFALDGVYGKFDKQDREFMIRVYKERGLCKDGSCWKENPVGVGWWIEPVQELGLPLTPEVIREYFIMNVGKYGSILARDNVKPSLPSQIITGKAKVDCDAVIPLEYTLLYKLNKAMGIRAEYYEVDIYPSGQSVGHSELFVYYPETGKWEVYSPWWVSMTYYYKYSGKGVNFTAWEKYTKLHQLTDVKILDNDQSITYMMTHGYTNIFILPPKKFTNNGAIYVKGGKIQFNSFEEALYWYLYWNAVDSNGLLRDWSTGYDLSEERALTIPISVKVYKLPTPEDPQVYRVKEWSGKKVTITGLKEELVRKGEYRELKVIIEKGEAPQSLKNPKPIPPEWLSPQVREWYYEEKARMEKEGGGGSSGISDAIKGLGDLLIKGLKKIFG